MSNKLNIKYVIIILSLAFLIIFSVLALYNYKQINDSNYEYNYWIDKTPETSEEIAEKESTIEKFNEEEQTHRLRNSVYITSITSFFCLLVFIISSVWVFREKSKQNQEEEISRLKEMNVKRTCEHCGAKLKIDDEFCPKCGKRTVLRSFKSDKKLSMLSSSYLAIGSVSLFLFVYFIGKVLYYSFSYYSYIYSDFDLIVSILLLLIGGTSIIIGYRGFINSKNYSKFLVIMGLSLVIISLVYILIKIITGEYFELNSLILNLEFIVLLVPTIIVLVITLMYWDRLP